MNEPEQPNDTRFPLTRNADSSSFTSAPSGSDASSTPTESSKASPKRRKKLKTVVMFAAVPLCLFAAFAGFFLSKQSIRELLMIWMGAAIKNPGKTLTGVMNRDVLAPFDYKTQLPPEKQHTINVLLLGCDHDYDDRTQQPIMTTPGRSDSIIMAHVDFDKGTIDCLSIPRDSAVKIPKHRGLHKVNAAHEFGDNALTIQTLKERFGLDTDYVFALDFESFVRIVDSIGGVDVKIHKKLDYDDNWGNLHVHLKPGFRHLTGYQAMGYVRIRHSDSDEMRSERQHEFIEALRKQIMDPRNCTRLPTLLDTLNKHIKSDLSKEQMFALAKFAKGLPKEKISLSTLPNEEGRSYCYIPQDKARKTLADVFFNGDQDKVHLDLPEAEEVAVLNHGRIVLNDRGESVGSAATNGSRKRKKARSTDSSSESSNDSSSLSPKGSRASEEHQTMSPDMPVRPPDENATDGVRSSNHSETKSSDKKSLDNGDTPKDKSGTSADKSGSKNGNN